MLILVLVIVSGAHATVEDNADDTNAIKDMMKGVLHKLCPRANVCLDNQTYFGNQVTELAGGEKTCCTDCSCEPNCDSKGNCCFKRNILRQERKDSESICLFPAFSQPLPQDRKYYQSYRIVYDVPKYDNMGNKINTTKCGDAKVAPLGSFLPVSSRKTKTIYKNVACASDSNVTDGVEWGVLLSCKFYANSPRNTDAASVIAGLYLSKIPDNCQVQFTYPGDYSDLTSERCFEDLISSCNDPDFIIPDDLPWSRNEVTKACTSGLISPYRKLDMYANVFCHICNGMYFAKSATCGDFTSMRGLGNGGDLAILLDGHLMSYFDHIIGKQPNIPLVCPIDMENEDMELCRVVYCPSGQIRDEKGQCIFAIKEWYMQTCAVYVKLKADSLFSIDEEFDMSVMILERDISVLVHQWPKSWSVTKLSYELGDENENRKDALLVEMTNNSPPENLKGLLTNIKTLLKQPWSLKLRNKTLLSMSADWVHIPDLFHLDPEYSSITPITGANFPVYSYIYKGLQSITVSPFPITRLYFCSQVELDVSEYEWQVVDIVLLNKINNKTFFPGEFTLIFSDSKVSDVDKLPVRICSRDSGFIKIESQPNSSANMIRRNNFIAFNCCFIMFIMSFNYE